jgi:EAL domain-containing protein (putative c-di-GMP-specific phosphodiesterase class I)
VSTYDSKPPPGTLGSNQPDRLAPEVPKTLESRHYSGRIEEIGTALSRDGALGLILVDGAPLERIERSYGIAAHDRVMEALRAMVAESCSPDFEDRDVIVGGSSSPDEIVIFFFRARSDDRFYREKLPELARRLGERIASDGQKIVYPYDHNAPYLPIGHATVFHNPGLGTDRQVLDGFGQARRDAALNAEIARRERHTMFQDLVLAEDVAILYEPIVNLTTREALGHEALVRGPWNSELHSPERLFALAEETGLVFELDCLCRRTALRGAQGLEAGRKLFLNCLPTAIHDPAFRGEVLRKTLQDLCLRPEDLVFEISERESIDNFTIFREARDHYKELGFQIALDDTGVAYGSLEAIMELAPDFIKVDLSLIRGIDTDPPRQELLRALHAVAGKVGGQIIAEGIETSEELATLQGLGIPYGQGYLFGRAAPLRRSR